MFVSQTLTEAHTQWLPATIYVYKFHYGQTQSRHVKMFATKSVTNPFVSL